MSKSTKSVARPVTANVIRAWAGENGFPKVGAAERGRLPREAVDAFVAANPGAVYVTGGAPKTVTLPVTKKSARGAVLKRPVEVPVTEARTLAGAPKTGRLSSKHIIDAARAFEAKRDSE